VHRVCGTAHASFIKKLSMTIEENHSKIWNYLNELRTGMLSTHSDGLISSRPMYLVQNDYEGTLYLFAEKNAQKVEDIRKSPTVNMCFSEASQGLYISLSGIASIVKSGSLFDHFWSDNVALWFSDHENPSEAAILITIDVTHADVWESKENKFTKAFEFIKAKFTDTKPEIGTHETIAQ
jgi:general stress protein 26